MRLSDWARLEGVHYQTAWKWFKDGTLPVPARARSAIRLQEEIQ
jgi:putative resolvase